MMANQFAVKTMFGLVLAVGTSAWAAPAEDTVSPAQAKLVLEFYHKDCGETPSANCTPGGVDLKKDEVRVLPRDLDTRKQEIEAMYNGGTDAHETPMKQYKAYLQHCKPPTPLKIKADIALYKMLGEETSTIYRMLLEHIDEVCQSDQSNAKYKANADLMRKIKLIDYKLVPKTDETSYNASYAFDEKTGTLTVGIYHTGTLGSSYGDRNWNQFLSNN